MTRSAQLTKSDKKFLLKRGLDWAFNVTIIFGVGTIAAMLMMDVTDIVFSWIILSYLSALYRFFARVIAIIDNEKQIVTGPITKRYIRTHFKFGLPEGPENTYIFVVDDQHIGVPRDIFGQFREGDHAEIHLATFRIFLFIIGEVDGENRTHDSPLRSSRGQKL